MLAGQQFPDPISSSFTPTLVSVVPTNINYLVLQFIQDVNYLLTQQALCFRVWVGPWPVPGSQCWGTRVAGAFFEKDTHDIQVTYLRWGLSSVFKQEEFLSSSREQGANPTSWKGLVDSGVQYSQADTSVWAHPGITVTLLSSWSSDFYRGCLSRLCFKYHGISVMFKIGSWVWFLARSAQKLQEIRFSLFASRGTLLSPAFSVSWVDSWLTWSCHFFLHISEVITLATHFHHII